MKIRNIVVGIGVLATLGVSGVALAESDRGKDNEGARLGVGAFMRMHDAREDKREDKRSEHKELRSVSGTVSAKTDSTITLLAKNNAVYVVNVANAQFKTGTLADIAVGDAVRVWGKIDGSAVSASHVFEISIAKLDIKKMNHVVAGLVTSVNGAVFTVDPFKKGATTTVTTNANTTFKVNGQATTSSEIGVGSKVILLGTTTATSTSGNSFSVSVVHIITKGFGHMKHWFSWR